MKPDPTPFEEQQVTRLLQSLKQSPVPPDRAFLAQLREATTQAFLQASATPGLSIQSQPNEEHAPVNSTPISVTSSQTDVSTVPNSTNVTVSPKTRSSPDWTRMGILRLVLTAACMSFLLIGSRSFWSQPHDVMLTRSGFFAPAPFGQMGGMGGAGGMMGGPLPEDAEMGTEAKLSEHLHMEMPKTAPAMAALGRPEVLTTVPGEPLPVMAKNSTALGAPLADKPEQRWDNFGGVAEWFRDNNDGVVELEYGDETRSEARTVALASKLDTRSMNFTYVEAPLGLAIKTPPEAEKEGESVVAPSNNTSSGRGDPAHKNASPANSDSRGGMPSGPKKALPSASGAVDFAEASPKPHAEKSLAQDNKRNLSPESIADLYQSRADDSSDLDLPAEIVDSVANKDLPRLLGMNDPETLKRLSEQRPTEKIQIGKATLNRYAFQAEVAGMPAEVVAEADAVTNELKSLNAEVRGRDGKARNLKLNLNRPSVDLSDLNTKVAESKVPATQPINEKLAERSRAPESTAGTVSSRNSEMAPHKYASATGNTTPLNADDLAVNAKSSAVTQPIGQIAEVSGNAYLRGGNSSRALPAYAKLPVKQGDVLQTSQEDGTSVLAKFNNGAEVTLGRKAFMEIREEDEYLLSRGSAQFQSQAQNGIRVQGLGEGKTTVIKGQAILSADEGRLSYQKMVPEDLAAVLSKSKAAPVDEAPPATPQQFSDLFGFTSPEGQKRELPLQKYMADIQVTNQLINGRVTNTYTNPDNQPLTVVANYGEGFQSELKGKDDFIGRTQRRMSAYAVTNNFDTQDPDNIARFNVPKNFESGTRAKSVRSGRNNTVIAWSDVQPSFTIAPRETLDLNYSILAWRPLAEKTLTYEYPLPANVWDVATVKESEVRFHIQSEVPLSQISTGSFPAEIEKKTPHQADVVVRFTNPPKDKPTTIPLVLSYTQQPPTIQVQPAVVGNQAWYFTQISPPSVGQATERMWLERTTPVQVLVLADTSASMQPRQRDLQKQCLTLLYACLAPTDEFNLALVDYSVDWLQPQALPKSELDQTKVLSFLGERSSEGWSDLDGALVEARKRSGDNTHVVYLGDGRPSSLPIIPDSIPPNHEPKSSGKDDVPLHVVIFDDDSDLTSATHWSWKHRATVQTIESATTLPLATAQLLNSMARPKLSQTELQVVSNSQQYGVSLPPVAFGTQYLGAINTGVPTKAEPAQVSLNALMGNERVEYRQKVSPALPPPEMDDLILVDIPPDSGMALDALTEPSPSLSELEKAVPKSQASHKKEVQEQLVPLQRQSGSRQRVLAEIKQRDRAEEIRLDSKLDAYFDFLEKPPSGSQEFNASAGNLASDWTKLAQHQDATKADRWLTTLIEQYPDSPQAHELLARVREKQGRWKEALTHWQYVLKLSPDLPEGWIGTTRVRLKLKDIAPAEQTWRLFISRELDVPQELKQEVEELRQQFPDKK